MESASIEDLRYPVGPFEPEATLSDVRRRILIGEIAALPGELWEAVEDLEDDRLDTPYRPDGWTVRQVVHHLADSHLNGYVRFRLALTEELPTIKPYDQPAWAELPDSRTEEVGVSLALLEALHRRWVRLLSSMSAQEYQRAYNHPETGPVRLETALQLYSWHGRHHLAHVTGLRKREGW